MSEGNKKFVENVNAAFAENNVEGFLSFCADDVVWTMIGDRSVRGKETIRKWMESMDMEPPTFTVDMLIGEGDTVAAYGNMTMKKEDGKIVPYAYCDIYRFKDALIMELISFVIKTGAKEDTSSET